VVHFCASKPGSRSERAPRLPPTVRRAGFFLRDVGSRDRVRDPGHPQIGLACLGWPPGGESVCPYPNPFDARGKRPRGTRRRCKCAVLNKSSSEPRIVLMSPSDQPSVQQEAQVANGLFKSLSPNVDLRQYGQGHDVAMSERQGNAGLGRLKLLLHLLGRPVGGQPGHTSAAAR
jgi:hypothetical protein